MDSLIDFINMIRPRPAMYIGGRSITILKAFLDGWIYGEEEINDIELLSQFQNWIEVRFKTTATKSWASIILFYSSDEVHALDEFFILWDQFLESIESHNF